MFASITQSNHSNYTLKQISCNVTARYITSILNPWSIPKAVRKPFFAGLKVSYQNLRGDDYSVMISFNMTFNEQGNPFQSIPKALSIAMLHRGRLGQT